VSLTSLTTTFSQNIDMLQSASVASIFRLVSIGYVNSYDLTCKIRNHVTDEDRS
jgi:hypothetical protein